MRGATADEALSAFKAFDALPKAVDTDDGTEFKQNFYKDPKDVNATAVVERRIHSIEKALSGMIIEEEHSDWVKLLDNVIKAINESPSDALHG